MGTVELLLTLCTLAATPQCEEHKIPLYNTTLMGCMVGGQGPAAEYLAAFPDRKITKYRCKG